MPLPPDRLAAIPEQFRAEAVQGLNLGLAEHRERARLVMATSLCRDLLAPTLVRTARQHGIGHVRTAQAAAFAIAGKAIPEPQPEREGA